MSLINWEGRINLPSKDYACGHCGKSLVSEKGWEGKNNPDDSRRAYIYICHYCTKPTFFDIGESQTPGKKFGNDVNHITDKNVEDLYEEARKCTSSNAFTAAVLCCRKLLMHIAVSKGAQQGEQFIFYVEYLSTQNYIPPGSKDWVDTIRSKGNEANHEIKLMTKEDAEDLLSFMEILLKIIYEFPARAKRP